MGGLAGNGLRLAAPNDAATVGCRLLAIHRWLDCQAEVSPFCAVLEFGEAAPGLGRRGFSLLARAPTTSLARVEVVHHADLVADPNVFVKAFEACGAGRLGRQKRANNAGADGAATQE
jgi:hypothetical protein